MDIVEEIKAAFTNIPPSWDEVRILLDEHPLSKEDLAEIALHVAHNCFCEYADAIDYQGLDKIILEETHSYYLIDSLKLLLDHGLDPNIIIDDSNVMWETIYIDIPNVGAAALRLLLEHGGNPNLDLPNYGTMFTEFDSRVIEDGYDYGFAHVVQCWMVLLAYGGRFQGKYSDTPPVTMLNGNKVEIFKNFEGYDYVFEWIPGQPHRSYRLDLLIFDKVKKEVVARRR